MKLWLILQGCGFIPGMDSLALELCVAKVEAEKRQIVVPGPSDAERDLFYIDVSRVVYLRKK
jgi:hypothetical protein